MPDYVSLWDGRSSLSDPRDERYWMSRGHYLTSAGVTYTETRERVAGFRRKSVQQRRGRMSRDCYGCTRPLTGDECLKGYSRCAACRAKRRHHSLMERHQK